MHAQKSLLFAAFHGLFNKYNVLSAEVEVDPPLI